MCVCTLFLLVSVFWALYTTTRKEGTTMIPWVKWDHDTCYIFVRVISFSVGNMSFFVGNMSFSAGNMSFFSVGNVLFCLFRYFEHCMLQQGRKEQQWFHESSEIMTRIIYSFVFFPSQFESCHFFEHRSSLAVADFVIWWSSLVIVCCCYMWTLVWISWQVRKNNTLVPCKTCQPDFGRMVVAIAACGLPGPPRESYDVRSLALGQGKYEKLEHFLCHKLLTCSERKLY